MQQPFFTTCILRKFSSLWSGPFSWQHNDVHTVALEKKTYANMLNQNECL